MPSARTQSAFRLLPVEARQLLFQSNPATDAAFATSRGRRRNRCALVSAHARFGVRLLLRREAERRMLSMNEGARRTFLLQTASAGLLVVGCGAGTVKAPVSEQGEEGVAPPEDLMREHGVLNRILLVYDESARRVEARQALDPSVLAKSADLIRRFIEQYHEKLEEDFMFPRFEKAGKLVDLVATLRRQHLAGRQLTEEILRLTQAGALESKADPARLVEALRSFARMYRPHEAREDTVLFPAFREVVSRQEFSELGEQFEDKEHELFGKKGFEGIVSQVEEIERSLGLFDLNQFTPG
jgi:hemerythrin-like domain-containing protein